MRAAPFSYLACLILAGVMLRAAEPTLLWSDEFNQPEGTAPDPAKWVHDLGNGVGGWGNKELETYTDSRENAFIIADAGALDGHALAIRAVKTASGGYTSARLKTLGKFAFTYGRIEARMQLTRGRGVWPAFWMLGNNFPKAGWPACGEIDIMEFYTNTVLANFGYSLDHRTKWFANRTPLAELGGDAWSKEFHIWTMEWDEKKITLLLDGKVMNHLDLAGADNADRGNPFRRPEYIILNQAIGANGGDPSQTTFPVRFEVDWVRVYQHDQ
jgi:beta-glucanase (GH16 family)